MYRTLSFAAVLTLLAAPATAQMHGHDMRSSIAQVETFWNQVTGHVMTVAKETAEEDYGYRPTDSVRSIGEMIGHIAGAQYMMCAAAMGDEPRAEDAVEEAANTKEALVAELAASTEYCAKAYQMNDMELAGETELWGSPVTRFYALTQNAIHNAEHYGNLITYLRMQGIVPPSSRR